MIINKDHRDLLYFLNEENTAYLLIGSFAVSFYLGDQLVKDFVIWAEPSKENALRIWPALVRFGAPLEEIQHTEFTKSDFVYQIGFKPNHITIVMDADGIDFSYAWRDRIICSYDDVKTYIVSKENLIKNLKTMNRPEDHINLDRLSRL
jgi:hypothetical protein